MLTEGTLYFLAIMAGISFSLIGIGLRLGTDRKLHPLHLVAVSSLMGTIVFGARALPLLEGGVPVLVIVLGIIAGLSQYGVIHLVKPALHMGPLSPLWCALMLGFVPVIVFAGLFRGEGMGPWQSTAVVLAIGCVVAASLGRRKEKDSVEGEAPEKPQGWWLYGVLLLAILVVNSLVDICIKDLGMVPGPDDESMWEVYGPLFLATLYLWIHVCVMADIVVKKRMPASFPWMLGLGALVGVGSMGGLWLVGMSIELPAAVLFTVRSVASILFTAVVGTLYFREERNWTWYATVGLGVMVVVFASL